MTWISSGKNPWYV